MRAFIALFGMWLTKVNLSWCPSKRWVGHANSCHLGRKQESAQTNRLFKDAKTRFPIFTFASNRLLDNLLRPFLFLIQAHKTGSTICGCTPFGFSHLLMYEVQKIIWMQPFTGFVNAIYWEGLDLSDTSHRWTDGWRPLEIMACDGQWTSETPRKNNGPDGLAKYSIVDNGKLKKNEQPWKYLEKPWKPTRNHKAWKKL